MNEKEFASYLAAEGYDDTGQSEYAPDMDADEHAHDFGFAALVLSGKFRLSTAESERTLGPGDMWSLEPGTPHAEKVLGKDSVVFLYGLKSSC
jgi:quercetin dioxygenase-like cupin family protein